MATQAHTFIKLLTPVVEDASYGTEIKISDEDNETKMYFEKYKKTIMKSYIDKQKVISSGSSESQLYSSLKAASSS